MEIFLTEEVMNFIDEKFEGLDDDEKRSVYEAISEAIDHEVGKLE